MREPLVDRVFRSVQRLIPQGSRVIVAVSGGPDSVALFSLLRELQQAGGYTVAALAHFNHRLRGADADADEAFCRDLAQRSGVAFASESGDVAAAARQRKTSIEDAARQLRYAFLERARLAHRADAVAVGHTRDDQAETFLLRVARGAGARGLGGIRERRGAIVRPLLQIGREELHAWLGNRGLESRIDVTNRDVSIPRNRVRHEVLPVLERVSPGATDAIARAAWLAADDDDFLQAGAIAATARIVLSDEGRAAHEVRLHAGRLRELHPAIARRVLRLALARVAPGRYIGLKHIETLRNLRAGSLDLPGVLAEVDAALGALTLSAAGGRPASARGARANVFRYPLSIPGEVCIRESGVTISAELVEGAAAVSAVPDTRAVRIPAGTVDGVLAVRNRQAGDRFRPVGLGGTKKLQDYFVDRKVPRSERDKVPLVVDGRDRIVWIVGHTIAEEFSRDISGTGPEGAVLLLKVRHLGESV